MYTEHGGAIAAEHACDFIDAVCGIQHGDGSACLAVARLFLYRPVVLTLRSDLRQMSDAQNLPISKCNKRTYGNFSNRSPRQTRTTEIRLESRR